jgi:hypothetical protein
MVAWNGGTVALIVAAFVLIIIMILLLTLSVKPMNNVYKSANITLNSTTKCTAVPSSLPAVGSSCCFVGGTLTDRRYVASLDLVVSPTATFYFDACAGFCQQGVDSTGTACIGSTTDTTKFQNCIALTKPVNCTGPALPIASNNSTLFYGYSATVAGCTDTRPCAI